MGLTYLMIDFFIFYIKIGKRWPKNENYNISFPLLFIIYLFIYFNFLKIK